MNEKRKIQQATGRTELGFFTRCWMTLAALLIRVAARLILATCRLQRVDGEEHLSRLVDANASILPCCWHQRLTVCAGYLLRAPGLRPGFLVSPSRDGELIARVVAGMGAATLRGSANRTGARALRELYTVLRDGISPIIHPDGPSGPAYQVKSGTLMLAQMTRAPLLPLSFAAERYWQLGSWDRLIIPKPFSRIVITVGEPMVVAKGDDIEARAIELGERLDTLTRTADETFGATPQHPASPS